MGSVVPYNEPGTRYIVRQKKESLDSFMRREALQKSLAIGR